MIQPFKAKDEFGNVVNFDGHKVMLRLANQKKIRSIGEITEKGNYIKSGLKSDKHKFRTYDGWGINAVVVAKLEETSRIVLEVDKKLIWLSKQEILQQKGSLKMFRRAGYELQYIIEESKFHTMSTWINANGN